MKIGIDLGTTNSLISYYSEEGPKIIPNRLGRNLTPSIVSIDEEGTVYVGEIAKERMAVHPEQCASVFKRSIGTDKVYEISGGKYKAEDLSALLLRYLKEDAESYLKEEIEEAIISVPAYFNDQQRKATKRAGELAGLKVERIINEPTAAAISYGLHNRDENTKFLVFDLGGGTFDVSILEKFQNIMEVRAIAGDNFIGGEDFTRILASIMVNRNAIDEAALSLKEQKALMLAAEKCKLGFSEGDVSLMKFGEYEEKITIKEYETACQLLLTKIRKPIERSLKDANLKLRDIDEVILVGGATKLSIIRRFAGRIFGRIPNCSIDPDETVVVGAAIQCAMKERNDEVRDVVLTEVCPFTLGTSVAISRFGDVTEGGHYAPIIERNTVIPVSRTETFYTSYDNQRKVVVDILQGESRLSKNNLLLGVLEVPVPMGKKGEQSIDVTYTYDVNAILEVQVKVNSTDEIYKKIVQSEDNSLTEDEIQQRFEQLEYLKIHPRDQEENKLLLARGERMYEEATGDLRKEIDHYIGEFEQVLNKQNKNEIEQARKELKRALDEIEELLEGEEF
ncbi:MAG: molecular chaperone HscC [Eubacterium sp.]|nr:molecular chaperone HscC [Eubacterium sp.]